MKLKLFTSLACPSCPKAKELLKDIEHEEVSINTPDGLAEATLENIYSVPTLIDGDKKYIGVEDIKIMLEGGK